ncbi:tyrosine/phenylalanine carboxypeptidase domain-containing protein [Piscirickettsia salmonis]|uniref:tyrosine/phenylalanine carboxypeptidase domain-containing protein n=1 Tax=Piscirickettsia salmonis TaxID=1238 RepID=UPI003A80688E
MNNSRRALLINRNAQFSALEIAALIHHELGVHLVTTMNALAQPLSVFRLGLPGDTYTQEGLAVLSEYLSGNINLHRLKQLSLRVVAVDMMVNGMSFSSVFNYLIEEHKITLDESFNLTMRVFRGGGFTKDYLYLSGLRDLAAFSQTCDVSPLLIGKTGLQFIDTLDSLLERQIVFRPQYVTPALSQNIGSKNEVLSYLISSIK